MSSEKEDHLRADKTKNPEQSSLDDRPRDFGDCRAERSSETDVSSAGAYLSRHLSAVLPAALGEIALKKPVDPVEYLGQWLLHYRECEDRERRRGEFEAELLEERLKLPREEEEVAVIADDCEDEGEEREGIDDDVSFDY